LGQKVNSYTAHSLGQKNLVLQEEGIKSLGRRVRSVKEEEHANTSLDPRQKR
jgi:hypothetical protein